MSDSLWPHEKPIRLFCPWNSPERNTAVGSHPLLQGILLTQGSLPIINSAQLLSHVWLLQPHKCILPSSSVHGILQVRILEWVAISFSRGSSWPRNWTQVSCIAGRFFTDRATREARYHTNRLIYVIDSESPTQHLATSFPEKAEAQKFHMIVQTSEYTQTLSHAQLFADVTAAHQPPLSLGFFRK